MNKNLVRSLILFLSIIILPGKVVAQSQPTITIGGTLSYTYNGTSQGTFTSTVVGSSSPVVYTYKGVGTSSSNYGPTTSKPKNAGLYQVVASVAANNTNNTLSASSVALNFTILKAASTIAIKFTSGGSFTYNGLPQGPDSLIVTGSTGLRVINYKGVRSTIFGPGTIKPTQIGTYYANAILYADTNYLDTTSKGVEFVIKGNSTVTLTGPVSFIYDGTRQGPNTSKVVGSTYPATYIYSGTGSTTYNSSSLAPLKVGTFQVVASVTFDTLYNAATSAPVSFTINQAASTISVTGSNVFTYNGLTQGPSTYSVQGSNGLVTYTYSGTGSTTYTATTTKPTNAGAYQVIAQVAANTSYLAASSSPFAFTIKKAYPTFLYTDVGFKTIFVYSGLPQGPPCATVAGSTGKLSCSYASTRPGIYLTSSIKPTNAGIYYIYSTVEETSNYLGVTDGGYPFSIWPNNTSITITGDTLYTFDGNPQGKITTTIKGSSSTPTYSYSGVGTTIYGPSSNKPFNIGSYQLIVKVPSDSNYSSANSTAFKFKIQEAPLVDTIIKDSLILVPPKLDSPVITPPKLDTPINVPVIKDTLIVAPIIDSTINDSTLKDSTSISINKTFASTIIIIGLNEYEYNGQLQGPVNSIVTGSKAIPKYFYSGTLGTVYGPSEIVPKNAGTYQVVVSVASDASGDSAISESFAFEIKRVVLTITAQNAERCFQVANPNFNYQIEGYINGDDSTALTTLPTVYTLASRDSLSGNYKLYLTEAQALNYSFNYVDGIFTIHPLPLATIQSAVNYVCDGALLPIHIKEGYSYSWYKNNIIIGSASDSVLLVNAYGNYACKLTSVFGCEAMASNVLSIMQYYAPTANFSTLYSCINLPVLMDNKSVVNVSGPVKFDWNNGVGESSQLLNPQFYYTSVGDKKITLTITPNFCPALKSTISKTVFIEDPTPSIKMPLADVVVFMPLMVQARNFGVSYNWTAVKTSTLGNVAKLLDSSNAETKILTNTDALLLVKITAANSCVTTDSMQVRVFKNNNVYLPNSFSPNGDGINDVFTINPVGIASLNYFRIYDSWGGLIFETNNLSQGWDGKLNGVRQPMASYTWMIQANDVYNNVVKEMGSVTLIR